MKKSHWLKPTSVYLKECSVGLRKAVWPEVVVSTGTEVLARAFGCVVTAMDILRPGGACGGDGGTRAGELGLPVN
jgi:hypothetical protein